MRYIKTYENFTPIKINSHKPFKVKKNLDKSLKYQQKGIKSLRRRLEKETIPKKRSDLNKDVNAKIKAIKDLNFKKAKQIEYFRDNPIKENLENSDENLIDVLSSPDFKPEDILNHIGFDEDDYEIPHEYKYSESPKYDKNGFTILLKSKELEDLIDAEEGTVKYIIHLTDYYSQYEYDAGDDELNYIHYYLSGDTLTTIQKLANIFDYKLKIKKEGKINNFFQYLGLKKELKNFKNEIDEENERAVEAAAKALLKKIPFDLSIKYDGGNEDLELVFDYDEMIEYMEKHELKNVKTIKDFLENLYEKDEFTYSIEQEGKYDFLGDFKDLNTAVYNVANNYVISPDDIFSKLIEADNLELFKNKMDLADFSYKYTIWIDYNKKYLNLFEIAKHYNGEILQWMTSNEFSEKLKTRELEDEIKSYDDFLYKENIEKYNM